MANNFSDSQVAISNNSLTDIATASNKSMVIAGTLSNTGGTSINVTLKKYDNSATTAFSILTLGSQSIRSFAYVISGFLHFGSSIGNFLYITFLPY